MRFFRGDLVAKPNDHKIVVNYYKVHRWVTGHPNTFDPAISYKSIMATDNKLIWPIPNHCLFTFYLDPKECRLVERPWHNHILAMFIKWSPKD